MLGGGGGAGEGGMMSWDGRRAGDQVGVGERVCLVGKGGVGWGTVDCDAVFLEERALVVFGAVGSQCECKTLERTCCAGAGNRGRPQYTSLGVLDAGPRCRSAVEFLLVVLLPRGLESSWMLRDAEIGHGRLRECDWGTRRGNQIFSIV